MPLLMLSLMQGLVNLHFAFLSWETSRKLSKIFLKKSPKNLEKVPKKCFRKAAKKFPKVMIIFFCFLSCSCSSRLRSCWPDASGIHVSELPLPRDRFQRPLSSHPLKQTNKQTNDVSYSFPILLRLMDLLIQKVDLKPQIYVTSLIDDPLRVKPMRCIILLSSSKDKTVFPMLIPCGMKPSSSISIFTMNKSQPSNLLGQFDGNFRFINNYKGYKL